MVTALGHGSAATAAYWRGVGSLTLAGRSSTTTSGFPAIGGGRFTGRSTDNPGVSNTVGSMARDVILRVGPSAMRTMR